MKKIKIKIWELTWANKHKLFFRNYEQAKLYAYNKAFYFDNVYLNGTKIDRKF